ncbi:hypothetical protein [Spiroplasma endosymbiont of Polydrusus pterygomalis]|uniref:hypothetical protein n=1 Tax=Spiroplasma endosymbiont of Polydrusus pterygomalis TaxID=3139327 RepID=UPI003CCA90F2
MIRQEIFSSENIQLIYQNQKVTTWKKVAIVSSIFLLSPLPGIGLGFLYNKKLTTELDTESPFSLPISMLIGAIASSLLTLSIVTPFFRKIIFSEWYQKQAEARYISKFSSDIKSLRDNFDTIINSDNENIKVELENILTELNNKKAELKSQEELITCQLPLEELVNKLSYLVINELVNLDYDYILVREINNIVNNSSESDEASTNSSCQLLVY